MMMYVVDSAAAAGCFSKRPFGFPFGEILLVANETRAALCLLKYISFGVFVVVVVVALHKISITKPPQS